MKFQDYKYTRPNLEQIGKDMEMLLEKFRESESFEEQNKLMEEINKIRSNVDTMGNLVYIRHSINTEDEFYAKEQDFLDENMPIYQNIEFKFYKELVDSKFRNE
ncbi:MAG: M3 family oligoendopeptidase, partial [Tissierellia bacterium]|nr:M3 family oligoendopeptidase [Tissierellia bacterium]